MIQRQVPRCNEVKRRNVDVEFEANVHAALVDYEMLKLMKEANFRQIYIGVESVSQKILNGMHKRLSIDTVRKIFKIARDVGLLRRASFLLGFPDETKEDVEMSFKLAEEIDPDVLGMTILCPF